MPNVAFDFAGPGGSSAVTSSTTTATWSHTATAGATVLVEATYNASTTSTITGLTRTATYGGVAMTSLGFQAFSNNGSSPYVEMFALANVPGGTQTVTVSAGAGTSNVRRIVGTSTSYTGVNSLGAAQLTSNAVGAAMSHTVTSAPGQMVHQVFGTVSTISGYNQTSRFNGTVASGPTIQVGDAPGAASVTFSADRVGNAAWASIAVTLIGNPVHSGTGSGRYGWIGHAVGKTGLPKGHSSKSPYGWAGSGRGKRPPKAHGVGGFMWQSTVRGNQKAHGATAGAWGWVHSGFGLRLPKGHGAGAYKWIGSGRSGAGGRSDGAYLWAGSAAGRTAPRGSSAGRYEWVYQHLAGIALHRLTIVPFADRSATVPAGSRGAVVAETLRAAVVPATSRRATVPLSANRTTIVPVK